MLKYFLPIIVIFSFALKAQTEFYVPEAPSESDLASDFAIANEFVQHYIDSPPPNYTECSQINFEEVDRKRLRRQVDEMQAMLGLIQFRIPSDPNLRSLHSRGSDALSQMQRNLRTVSTCEFQREIRAQLTSVGAELNQNAQFLTQLNDITTCLSSVGETTQFGSVFDFAKESFSSIFNFFWSKSQRENLTQQDCEVLRQTYSVWASFYDDLNDKPQVQDQSAIPLYNVNPHNSSYFYWMQERQNGRIPPQGLPILHADTHTDLGHVHYYAVGSSDQNVSNGSPAQSLPFTSFDEVFDRTAANDRPGLIEVVNQGLSASNYPEEEKQRLRTFIANAPMEEIVQVFNEATRLNVHEIAQPLIGAVASGLSSSVTLALPEWNPRLTETTKFENGRAVPLRVSLNEVALTDYERVLSPSVEESSIDPSNTMGVSWDNRMSPINIFDRKNDSEWSRPSGITFDMTVTNLTRETPSEVPGLSNFNQEGTNALRPFSDYLPASAAQDGFILDIDLDAFVSNGRGYSRAEPVSYGRTQNQDLDSRNPQSEAFGRHEQFNELDSNVEVLSTEMDLIRSRIDTFFNRLEASKEQGVLPKVITIADSTNLLRAIEGQENDAISGGNFTPSCMAFLLNYMVRERLKDLYPIDAR